MVPDCEGGVSGDGVVLSADPDLDGGRGEEPQGLVDHHVQVLHLLKKRASVPGSAIG